MYKYVYKNLIKELYPIYFLTENARRRDGVVGRSPVYLTEYVPRVGRVDSFDVSPVTTPMVSTSGDRHPVWPGASVGSAAARSTPSGGPAPLHLFSQVDLAPVTVTERTPMAVVIDLFRKLGLRQALVTKHGCACVFLSKMVSLWLAIKNITKSSEHLKVRKNIRKIIRR